MLLDTAGDRVHLCLGLSLRYTQLEPRDGVVVVKLPAFGLKIQTWYPDARVLRERSRVIVGKGRRQNAHNRIRQAVQRDWFPDEFGVASEVFLPKSVAHNHRRGAPLLFFWQK